MSSLQLIKRQPEPKPVLFAGIDVGSEELVLVIRKDGKPLEPQTFANTAAGRAQLIKKLAKLPGIITCLEATGIYHFDLAVALHDAGVPLMAVNPKASRNFAKVLLKTARPMPSMPGLWPNMPNAWILSPGRARPTRSSPYAVLPAASIR